MKLNQETQSGGKDPGSENMHIVRTILFGGLLFLVLLNIILNEMRFYLPEGNYQGFERWVGLILLIVALMYAGVSILTDSGHAKSVRALCRRMCAREQIALTAIFVWFVIDCLIYQSMGVEACFQKNDYPLYLTGLSALVFFPLAEYVGSRKARPVIEGIIHIVVISYTIYSAWCLWHYLQMDYVVFPSGKQLAISVNGSLSMGNNRNIVGTAAGVMFSLCLYMIVTQTRFVKVLYGLQLLVNLAVLLLSNCRSGLVGVIAVLVSTIWIVCWMKLPIKKTLYRVGICALLSLSCIVLLRASQKLLFQYLNHKLVTAQTVSEETNGQGTDEEERATSQTTETVAKNSAIKERDLTSAGSNGRSRIWGLALQIIYYNPRTFWIGVTPGQLRQYFKEVGNLSKGPYHTHNLYLQIATTLGVPALTVFIFFLLSLAIRCFRIIRFEDARMFEGAWFVPIILLYLLIVDLVEPMLFTSRSVNQPFFYMLAGWIVAMDTRYLRRSGSRRIPKRE